MKTIWLKDGYNGHMVEFFAEPIEEDELSVKLARVPDRLTGGDLSYQQAWRLKEEWQNEIDRLNKMDIIEKIAWQIGHIYGWYTVFGDDIDMYVKMLINSVGYHTDTINEIAKEIGEELDG